MAKKSILIILAVILGAIVVVIDAVLAFGLSFTSPSHYTASLFIFIFIACVPDLPGLIVSLWRPRFGSYVILAGIAALCTHEVYFFMSVRELPTHKVIAQDSIFIALKSILAWLLERIDNIVRKTQYGSGLRTTAER